MFIHVYFPFRFIEICLVLFSGFVFDQNFVSLIEGCSHSYV